MTWCEIAYKCSEYQDWKEKIANEQNYAEKICLKKGIKNNAIINILNAEFEKYYWE